jgi:hypothetical protein
MNHPLVLPNEKFRQPSGNLLLSLPLQLRGVHAALT